MRRGWDGEAAGGILGPGAGALKTPGSGRQGERVWLQFVKWPPEVDSGLAQRSPEPVSGSCTWLSLKPVSLWPRACTVLCTLSYPPRLPLPTTQPMFLPHPMSHHPPLSSFCLSCPSPRASPPPMPPSTAGASVLISSPPLHPSPRRRPQPLCSLIKPSLLVVSSNLLPCGGN